MILYHFTCLHHWREIETDGRIHTVEANLVPPDAKEAALHQVGLNSTYRPKGDKKVVWLTEDKTPTQEAQPWTLMPKAWGWGLPPEDWDKTVVRITVNVRQPKWWPSWAREHGIPLWWYRALDTGQAHSWYVVPRPILRGEWVLVENVKTGAVLWRWPVLGAGAGV